METKLGMTVSEAREMINNAMVRTIAGTSLGKAFGSPQANVLAHSIVNRLEIEYIPEVRVTSDVESMIMYAKTIDDFINLTDDVNKDDDELTIFDALELLLFARKHPEVIKVVDD